ncbi:uncharacterized protein [Apostichopus japonicus]|uniref:uncharacterized protein isoform X1 n=1 Tax=Stichopus japonicus TaxID=307972 RepID=UPI003AB13C2B
MTIEHTLLFLVLEVLMTIVEGREYCKTDDGDEYVCDVGHCCGNEECCTYYYELWWFWLVWFLIVFVIGFCVWQRKKLRPWREHQYRNRSGLCGPPDLYPDILPIPPVKLPTYAEIGETASFDTPPPPYTCGCYIQGVLTTGRVGSFDQPPPDSGAPPCYMQYAQIIAPLMPRLQPNTSTGTQFPEGSPTTVITISTEQLPPAEVAETPEPTDSSSESPDSPCLSCSSPSSPLTSCRSCSCSSVVQSSSLAPARPGHAVSARLVSELYLKPTCFQQQGSKEWGGLANHFHSGSRLQVPFSGPNFNPCPRCVSRSVSSLRHCVSSSAIMRDASTSTLPQVDPPPVVQTAIEDEEPQRRNSYSLPRNFVCSTKLKK